MSLVTQWCTELYPTDAEEGVGRVGNFSVIETSDVLTALRQLLAMIQVECCALNEVESQIKYLLDEVQP